MHPEDLPTGPVMGSVGPSSEKTISYLRKCGFFSCNKEKFPDGLTSENRCVLNSVLMGPFGRAISGPDGVQEARSKRRAVLGIGKGPKPGFRIDSLRSADGFSHHPVLIRQNLMGTGAFTIFHTQILPHQPPTQQSRWRQKKDTKSFCITWPLSCTFPLPSLHRLSQSGECIRHRQSRTCK